MGAHENKVRAWYDPRRDRPLSDAILNAIVKAKGTDLTKEECALYEDIDPAALDQLFQESGRGKIAVMFNTSDVGVRLINSDKTEIRVASLTEGESQ